LYFTAAELRRLAAEGPEARLFRGSAGRSWANLVVKDRDPRPVAELHERETDVYAVLEGEAILRTGGTIADASSPTPGQWRGSSLDGAVERTLAAGDVAVIPAGTPHLVDARVSRIVYLVVKETDA